MTTILRALAGFVRDESGAVTVDWVALTAGTLLLGIAVVFAVYTNGVTPLTAKVNDTISGAGAGMCADLEADLGLEAGDCDSIVGDAG